MTYSESEVLVSCDCETVLAGFASSKWAVDLTDVTAIDLCSFKVDGKQQSLHAKPNLLALNQLQVSSDIFKHFL